MIIWPFFLFFSFWVFLFCSKWNVYYPCSSLFCSYSISYLHGPDRLGKQLSDLVSPELLLFRSPFNGLLGVDLIALGESKLRLRICLMAAIKCTVGSGGGTEDLNFLQKFMCLFIASSVLSSLSDLMISSFMASPQRPHIHLP